MTAPARFQDDSWPGWLSPVVMKGRYVDGDRVGAVAAAAAAARMVPCLGSHQIGRVNI